MADKKTFKYYPESFSPLTVKVKHMNLFFNVYDDHTDVNSEIQVVAREDLRVIELNADDLDLNSLELSDNISSEYKYDYNKSNKIITISLNNYIPKGTEFSIKTQSVCKPTKNILEGLYYDETPEGQPTQQITQCQQWGFQRLVPCFDDMSEKCTYKTTIEADSRYTHLITNGDIVEERVNLGNGRSKIVYDNSVTPMSTYLFFLGVGTWEEYKRSFEYPNGDCFDVELLVLPNSDKDACSKAMDMIYSGILWIHLYTGKDKYNNVEEKKKIWNLFWDKEAILKGEKKGDVDSIRAEIKSLSENLNFGYKYTGTVYREIAMQNSNFGGMENVGNTTITANRLLPTKEMSDNVFGYLMEVKQHEFYHNINGSEVTGWSPFEFWLNEAITCYVEAEYLSDIAGEGYARLHNLHKIIFPGGTFDEDKGAAGMPILPDGFNHPDELVSGVTYSKSPEFINMLSLIMGKEEFVEALDAYHKKFSHSNATNEDFRAEMEDVAGRSFERFFNVWLKQTGYPELKITKESSEEGLKLNLIQSGFKEGMHWEFPLKFAVFDKQGFKLFESQTLVDEIEQTIIVAGINLENVGYISANRDLSFYGKVILDESDDELYLQAKTDDDLVARHTAFLKLGIKEMDSLMNEGYSIPDSFVDLYYSYLSDESLCDKLGVSMIAIPETVEDVTKKYNFEELYQAKRKLRKSIANKYSSELLDIYKSRKDRKSDGSYVEKSFFDIKNRQVKNTCLSILSELDDNDDILDFAKDQFENPICNSDKMIGFMIYLKSNRSDKYDLIDKFENQAKTNLVEWEQFLATIAMNEADDALDIIKRLKSSKDYRIEQSNDQRALLMRFAMNQRKSLCTLEGREFLEESILELTNINEYNTNHLLSVLAQLSEMPDKIKIPLIEMLNRIKEKIDKNKVVSVYSMIERILSSCESGN